MKKLLIVSGIQYGYLIDYYYHAKNMSDRFDITYLCMDEGEKRIDPAGCRVVYVSKQSRINRRFDMLRALRKIADAKIRFDVVLTDFSYSATMFFPLYRKIADKFIFDIRTLDISENAIKRNLKNRLIAYTASQAPFVTVITRPIGDVIGLPHNRSAVIPLGAPEPLFDLPAKKFDTLRILYIGTFRSRHIDSTVYGLSIFLKRNPQWRGKVSYDIVGGGFGENEVRNAVTRCGLSDIITMHGFVPSDRAMSFFERNNVGVSFIPTSGHFDLQPPTKTYEYMAAGMAVLATATTANSELVDASSGILSGDTPEDFAVALQKLVANFKNFNSEKIRSRVADNHWGAISNRLADILSR